MANKFEIKDVPPEMREKFKNEITSRIIFEGVPEVLKNCEEKERIDDKDISDAIGWMLNGDEDHEGYKDSDVIGRILGFEDHHDRDAFFDHIVNVVTRKARELKGTYGEIPIIMAEEKEITGRKLYRGERNMLKLLMGEVFTALHKKRLTTEDSDFESVSKKIINKILDDYEVDKVTDEAGREQFRREITAVVHKSFTPEALAKYEEKKEMKGKKYSPEEKDMLLGIIEETVERVSIIMENDNLDIEEVRGLIKSTLAQVLTKNDVSSENQKGYIEDLTPLILDGLKEPPKNPVETILKKLYEK